MAKVIHISVLVEIDGTKHVNEIFDLTLAGYDDEPDALGMAAAEELRRMADGLDPS